MTDHRADMFLPFEIQNRCRKHLVFVDGNRITQVIGDVKRMVASGYPVEWNVLGKVAEAPDDPAIDSLPAKRTWSDPADAAELASYVANQPMGTHLYIAASWNQACTITQLAETIGYAKEDMQIRGYGQKFTKVFCIACYTTNAVGDAPTVVCQQCARVLSVSDHYSRRLDAVIGYILLNNR